jgi:hypothetical protein
MWRERANVGSPRGWRHLSVTTPVVKRVFGYSTRWLSSTMAPIFFCRVGVADAAV